MRRILTLLFACLLIGFSGCAQNPVTGRQNFVLMSETDEVKKGSEADKEVREAYGVYELAELQQYVNEVGQRLAKKSHRAHLDFHFTVVDSPEINAFALPGGYIYITRGMLAYLDSEAEIAAVLGHEIGHVTARHSVQQYSASIAATGVAVLGSILLPELRTRAAQNIMGTLGNALLAGYGREHELEADRLGAEYLARVGYDPQAMVGVLRVLKNQELYDIEVAKREGREPRRYHGLFATHPDNDTRLQQVVAQAVPLSAPRIDSGRERFLKRINGIIYGDSPAQGMVRKNIFYHPDMGFVLEFPQGWRIQNQPERLLARSPRDDSRMQLQIGGKAQGSPIELLRKNINFDSGSRADTNAINGLPAALVSGTSSGQPLLAATIFFQGNAYVILGAGRSAAEFRQYETAMAATARSFHAMRDAERQLVKPWNLRTTIAKPGTTMAKLAAQSPLGDNAEGLLRLINHLYPGGEPQSGQLIKVVD
ncbi:MAG: M48 family metalloprotease [Burkholderiales bacterium]